MAKSKRTKALIIALCAVLFVTAGVVVAVLSYLNGWFDQGVPANQRVTLQNYDKILPGVSICGVDVSGLTQEEASERVAAVLSAEVSNETFEVDFPDHTLTIRGYLDQSIPTLASAVKEAYQHGREGVTYLDDAKTQAEANPLALTPAVDRQIDTAKIRTAVETYASTLESRATDCRIRQTDNTIEITKGKDGKSLNVDALCRSILDAVKKDEHELTADYTLTHSGERQLRQLHETLCVEGCDAHWDPESQTIAPEVVGIDFDLDAALAALDAPDGAKLSIPLQRSTPTITAAALEEKLFADRLAHYSSPHTPIPARTTNLTLACQAINGTIINPGEVFSFNDTVGERTPEKGYQNAAIYIDGETADGLGGGVCQVASTIYYCALMGNLEIVERCEHMYFVDYVPPGMDATVYWGSLDFRFRNDTEYPLRIDASVSDGYVHIDLYGTNEDGKYAVITYEQLSETPWEDVIKEDETLPPEYSEVTTTPYTGRVIRTYRNVYDKDGTLLSTNIEAKSTYHKRDRVTTVGKQPETPPETEDPPSPVEPGDDEPTSGEQTGEEQPGERDPDTPPDTGEDDDMPADGGEDDDTPADDGVGGDTSGGDDGNTPNPGEDDENGSARVVDPFASQSVEEPAA